MNSDHLGVLRRVPATTHKAESEEFGRKLDRLAAIKMTGEVPDVAMTRWLEGLPSRVKKNLVSWGLIDKKRFEMTRLLEDHLKEFKQSILDDGRT